MDPLKKAEMIAQTMQNNINMQQPPPSSGMSTSFGECPQCGLSHPPIPQGTTCPNAPVKGKTEDGQEKIVDLNQFFSTLKNIFISQISIKNIKDPEKMFKYLIVEVTKKLEEYKE